MTNHQGVSAPDRPDFLVTLGLLPPCTAEDIHMAYREKAKQAHPDHGGSVGDFLKLQEDYERALEYAKFRAGRRQWLAAQVERYAHQEEVIAEVRRLGGQVEVEEIDWLKRSIGDDFALLTERLRGIRLRGLADGDGLLHHLAAHRTALGYLLWLDLAGSRVSDDGLMQLAGIGLLQRLDVSGTPLTGRGLKVFDSLPHLRWLNLCGTSVGWWDRWRLHRTHPRIKVVVTPAEDKDSPVAPEGQVHEDN